MLKKTVQMRWADTAVMWIVIDTLHSRVFPLCTIQCQPPPIPASLCSVAGAVLLRMTNIKVCFHCWETQSSIKVFVASQAGLPAGELERHTDALEMGTANRRGTSAFLILKIGKFSVCWKYSYYILLNLCYQTRCRSCVRWRISYPAK